METKTINRILVVNRGEIALRVMRSIHEMGLTPIAVYSEADRNAPHVLYADEAYLLGPPPSSESYLKIDAILDICKSAKIDAIHPGYGFLSENASFAERVEKAGVIFIGPGSDAIRKMGDKLLSKQTVADYDVPLVPGMQDPVSDTLEALKYAEEIGFPVMVKASAGGGGKGMRVVTHAEEFADSMERAKSEAKSAFGDDAVFVEKMITNPKHIEVQILGDQHGNYVYLNERECSVQRRNQKVIEEAPSAVINKEKRQELGEAAVNVARSCNYHGAGTVEFIADGDLNFYFLEMNTRLQVEHPVTEMITGFDLVQEQIRIAQGMELSMNQSDIGINGHSIEVRVYAEDPKNNFLPSVGRLIKYRRPQGPGVRVDDGYEEGMEIPIHYDPMISKLVVHGENREIAIQRMLRAIDEYTIIGVETTLDFCSFALRHPVFQDGSFTTKFVEEYFSPEKLESEFSTSEEDAILLAASYFLENQSISSVSASKPSQSSWKARRNG